MSLGVPGRTWSIDDEHRTSLITYHVMPGSFRLVNEQEVQAALAQRGSTLTNASGAQSWKGAANSANLPQFLAHATSVARGLQICCDGKFKPEASGKIGVGVYCFSLPTDKDESAVPNPDAFTSWLVPAWKTACGSGYNKGCLMIIRPKGIVVHGVPDTAMVPPGSTAFIKMAGEKSQWCVNPDSFEWVSFTFSVDSLLHYLQEQLDALGYTAKLHRAILNARDVLEKNTVIDKKRKREDASINAGQRSRGSGQVDAPKVNVADGLVWHKWKGTWWTQFDGSDKWWMHDKDRWFTLNEETPPLIAQLVSSPHVSIFDVLHEW